MQTRQESSARLHLVPNPVANAVRISPPISSDNVSRVSTRTFADVQVPDLIRRLDYVIAALVAILCSYWILQGPW